VGGGWRGKFRLPEPNFVKESFRESGLTPAFSLKAVVYPSPFPCPETSVYLPLYFHHPQIPLHLIIRKRPFLPRHKSQRLIFPFRQPLKQIPAPLARRLFFFFWTFFIPFLKSPGVPAEPPPVAFDPYR
jgi:hypothetical protein